MLTSTICFNQTLALACIVTGATLGAGYAYLHTNTLYYHYVTFIHDYDMRLTLCEYKVCCIDMWMRCKYFRMHGIHTKIVYIIVIKLLADTHI